ncbi:odorant receptor 42a-like [Drosophila innubila]|uniref:odorant receptor 42a-like n=1 Tax=Drosophila innubila TaxID=198719 RepID=UPI00148E44D1|nr:odorant receptor 42a-like [Drosophila innubila]
MAFRKMFPSLYTADDKDPAKSRNATLYLLRCIFWMGIRTPPQSHFWQYCLWSFVLNLSSTIYQPISFTTGYIMHASELTPSEFFTSLQTSFNTLSCAIKVVIVWIYVKRFDIATGLLDEMDKWLIQPSERRIIHRAVAFSNRVFFFFMPVFMTYATTAFLSAIVRGRPPYQNYNPILDWRADKLQLWIQAGLEYFAMAGACFQAVCVDCYAINFTLALRAHMGVFKNRLRLLGNNSDETPEQSYEKLTKCIKDHKVILRFCDTLRPIIGGTIFVQLLILGITLGFTIVNIVQFANFNSGITAFSFIGAVLLETTPFCILCNYLTDDSLMLADALFESNWIDQNDRYKKTLIQFLQHLQKPLVFMAGNILTISMATNLTASKFAISVITLIQNMNIAEKFERLPKPHETEK